MYNSSEMTPLSQEDTFNVNSAIGWLELGNQHEAADHLQKISAAGRSHPQVMETEYRIAYEAKQWGVCLASARMFRAACPEEISGWIQESIALHKLGKTQEAYELLSSVTELGRQQWSFWYNWACYSCRLGNLPEAKEWLKRAFQFAEKAGVLRNVREHATTDEDLQALLAAPMDHSGS